MQSNQRSTDAKGRSSAFHATMRTLLSKTAWLPVILLLLAPLAQAQYRASIQGVVADPTGAVIPGATLTLTDTATNKSITATSNGEGLYNFNALPADRFVLTAEMSGFQKKILQNVQITPEQANSINVTLEINAASETVTVDATATTTLDTENATISGTVSSNEIQHMPSFGRDVFQLSQLAPGSFGDGSQSAGGGTNSLPGTQGPGGPGASTGIFATENGPQVLAAGGQYENNGISIDGISTTSAVWGGTSVITPTEDSIDNVHIVTNAYDAEDGRFSGAQIQVTSKSGTNDIHGSVFFAANRPGLNAYQRYNGTGFYSNPDGTASEKGLQRDDQFYNQYGGSIGGPFWKNKLFGFFAYETQRNNSSDLTNGWYDTPAFDKLAPSNSIASTYLTFAGAQVNAVSQINQTCTDAGLKEGVNCVTVAGGLDIGSPLKSALGTQDLSFQNSNNPGLGSGFDGIADIGDYTTSNPTNIVETQYNGRLDGQVRAKDHLSFAIYWVPVSTTDYNGPVRAYNLFHHDALNDAISVIWNHTFTPTLLNEARANAGGWRWNEQATNPQAPFGLPSDAVANVGTGITNFSTFGAPGASHLDQWTYTYRDILTKVLNRHTLKFGGELTRLYYLNENLGGARPNYTFFNVWDFLNDAPEGESGNFDPLTGEPTANRQDNRENLWGFFVQDDFKVTPNLTLNFGLRYTYNGPLTSKENNMNVVVPGSGTSLLTSLAVPTRSNLYDVQKGNFGPQFGFAYNPEFSRKLVIRGGFGLNYNQEEIAISANGNGNPPATIAPNYTSTDAAPHQPRHHLRCLHRYSFVPWFPHQHQHHL
jgi:hypothetical protein